MNEVFNESTDEKTLLMMVDFKPAFWLRNPHVQSILASSPIRKSTLKRKAQHWMHQSRTLLLNGKEGNHLIGYYNASHLEDKNTPLAILLHGWEGTAQSGYLLSLANHLYERGYQILRLTLRDHDTSHHLNRELFHSCRLDEVVNAILDAKQRLQPTTVYLAGFSLGGNFALRATSALAQQNSPVDSTVAVCPVIVPADTMKKLDNPISIYQAYFTRKWKNSIRKKMNLFPEDFQHLQLEQLKSLKQLTDYFVEYHTHFPDTASYFEGYRITPELLSHLSTPTHIIMSADDPIIDADLLKPFDACNHLTIHQTAYGGHCGFIMNRRFDSWVDEVIYQLFQKADLSNKN